MFEYEGKLYDKRVSDRYRAKGLVSQKDYDAYLKALPDDSANAQWIQMDLHDAEIGGEVYPNGEDEDGDR